MANKVQESMKCVKEGTIPEARARKFKAAVAKRAKKREHAKQQAKRRRKS